MPVTFAYLCLRRLRRPPGSPVGAEVGNLAEAMLANASRLISDECYTRIGKVEPRLPPSYPFHRSHHGVSFHSRLRTHVEP